MADKLKQMHWKKYYSWGDFVGGFGIIVPEFRNKNKMEGGESVITRVLLFLGVVTFCMIFTASAEEMGNTTRYDITQIALGTSPSINNVGEIVWNVGGGVGVTQVVSNMRGQVTSGSTYHTWPSINDKGEIVWACCSHKQIESSIRGIVSGEPVQAVTHPEINDKGEIVWHAQINWTDYIISNTRGVIASGIGVGHPSINDNGEIVWHQLVPSGEFWTDPLTGEVFPIMYYQIMSNIRGQVTSGNYDHSMPSINDNGEIVWVENWNKRIVSNINGTVDEVVGTGYVFDPDINDKGEIVYQKQIGYDLFVMKATPKLKYSPVASFTYSPEKPILSIGQEITFNASSSYDPDGQIVKYEWDFGDGTIVEGKVVTHHYTEPGEYTVSLTVSDDSGLTNSTSTTIRIILIPGDILLGVGTKWVPGYWSHVGMYIGNGEVVESHKALGGVAITPLEDWFERYPTWAALRVITANEEIRKRAINWATDPDRLDDPYDGVLMWWQKDANGEAWYCSELVWAAYLHASNGQIDIEYHGPWEILEGAVTPDEIWLDQYDNANTPDIAVIAGDYDYERLSRIYGREFIIVTESPVDLEVVDPDDLVVNKQSIGVPGAGYGEYDIDGDGDLEDWIAITEPKAGKYLISVIPEPDASPADTYTLKVLMKDAIVTLAENASIGEIPEQPYLIQLTETEIKAAPIADANGPYQGIEGQSIEFNASLSYDPEGMPLTYYWEFGDGETAVTTQPTITHIYAQEGNYTVTLIVNDSVQNSTPSITYALINDTEPKASFTANITSGFAPLTVQFLSLIHISEPTRPY